MLPDDDRERMALYKQGLNDYEIASGRGWGKSTISKLALETRLPPWARASRKKCW